MKKNNQKYIKSHDKKNPKQIMWNLRVSTDFLNKLSQLAELNNTSNSEIIRQLVEAKYLQVYANNITNIEGMTPNNINIIN